MQNSKSTYSKPEIIDEIIGNLINRVQQEKKVDNHVINRIILQCAGNDTDNRRKYAKKHLVPYFLGHSVDYWGIDEETKKAVLNALRIKPRRTASGVATITVLTKPWVCSGACIFCPSDIRMPKSYLADEPACQRAEFAYFDPYLQMISRLRALKQMAHPTDKIEIIVLGGTWSDYPEKYQIWYVKELFRALNDAQDFAEDSEYAIVTDNDNPYKIINNSLISEHAAVEREKFYTDLGLTNDRSKLAENIKVVQDQVITGAKTFNQAIREYYGSEAWQKVAHIQSASWAELEHEHARNEISEHRVVGLVIETRPDTITYDSAKTIRKLGCTKVQMGVQSLQQDVLDINHRRITIDQIAKAHSILRLFGFKIHIHFMVNLLSSTPEKDIADYQMLISDPRFLPDEVKLYPCVLVWGTELIKRHNEGSWQAYSHDDLVKVLVADTLATPRYARISRMIRDISAHDIVAGNKKSNLRQMVEQQIEESGQMISEIRHREIAASIIEDDKLQLKTTHYQTCVADEYFLEWVTATDSIVGFLRLSLPHQSVDFAALGGEQNTAMIREVHIYGKVANLGDNGDSGQHRGLGRALVEEACSIANREGFAKINVISAIGTREYYRNLGFSDAGLYLAKQLA